MLATACYEDKGNYDYVPINEIEVDGIEPMYLVDVDDSLKVSPKIAGTIYSDTTRFSYAWEIGTETLSTSHDLNVQINLQPGYKYSRFVVTDKETGIKTYKEFGVNVSSSTAGDLIVVLSKYQGRAELSYLRLDKPANWAVNYFQDRTGSTLGSDPQQLAVIYCQSARNTPFVNKNGRVIAIVDNVANLIDKNTMQHDTVTTTLTQEAYMQLVSYPLPEISGYRTEFINEGFSIWRIIKAYGSVQMSTHFMEISNGKLWTAASLAPSIWTASYYYDKSSPYKNGYLSPFGYWDEMEDVEGNAAQEQHSYTLGDFIVFDKNAGRFASASAYGSITSIDEANVHAFPGYTMIWGSATSRPNTTSIAALSNGGNVQLVMLQAGTDATSNQPTKKLVAEVSGGNVMNADSKFYVMKYNDNLFFSKGNTMYRYNILNLSSGVAPSDKDRLFTLSDFGYDQNAVITDFCVSRTERTVLVGVSRYGADKDATGDEAKGDLLWFDLDKGSGAMTYNAEKSHKGIAGIPVDVEIKYQTHYRNGQRDEVIMDNI